MSLRLILGRAGTGKTQYCLESIRAELRHSPDGPPLVFLVPDQATFQMERMLIQMPDLPGFARAQVLSFTRLARRVILQTGGAARPQLGELGRRMLLRAVLLQLEGTLEIFGQSWRQPGFLERLQRTLGELRAYAHSPDELRTGLEKLLSEGETRGQSQTLVAKVRDLERIYRVYREREEQECTSPDQLLDLAAQRLSGMGQWRGCRVWVDGFAGFTPQELRLLAALLGQASQTEVALCLDSRRFGRAHATAADGSTLADPDTLGLFAPTERTAAQLLRLAEQLKVPILPPLRLDSVSLPPARFAHCPLLAAVEGFWSAGETSYPPSPVPAQAGSVALPNGGGSPETASQPPAVTLVQAASRRLEVEAAAQQIRLLVQDRGWRWRDIGVLVWSLEPYQAWLENVLTQWGIPYFLDIRRSLTHHPAVELVRSALAVVTGGWQTADVLQYLKTDLAGVSRDEVDRLEEYAVWHGVNGEAAWATSEPWTHWRRHTLNEEEPGSTGRDSPASQLAELDSIRRRAVDPLRRLARRLRAAGAGSPQAAARAYATALYQLWEEVHLPDQLQRWMETERQEGNLVAAEEDRQVWQQLVGLLDELVVGLGDQPLTAEEFRQVLESGLASLTLGLVPPSLDQVVIGTVERSRLPAVRAVLLLGAAAGEFPAVPREDAVLADPERELLAQAGVALADSAKLRLLHQPYFVYIAATRASDFLWASYPLADSAGRPMSAASWWVGLQERFGLCPQQILSEDDLLPTNLREWAGRWVQADPVRQRRAQQTSVYRQALADPVANWILDAPRQTGAIPPLSPATTLALYGQPVRTSISRLETLASCPFQHLAAYGWRLQKWERPELGAVLFGQVVHAAWERWARQVKSHLGRQDPHDPYDRPADGPIVTGGWERLTAAQAKSLLDRILDGLQQELERELPRSGRLFYQEQVIRRVLTASLPPLLAQIQESAFRPWRVEVPFEEIFPLREGPPLHVRGRIDRIDLARTDGCFYVRVIDYKTGRVSTWQPRQLEWGLAVQLVAYLAVACLLVAREMGVPLEQVVPAGAFYFPVGDPLLTLRPAELMALTPEKLAAKRRNLWRLQGPLVWESPVRELLDRQYQGGQSGTSLLVPVSIKKDGTPSRRGSQPLDLAGMQQLLETASRKVVQLGQQILSGEVTPQPYRLEDGSQACTFCPYHAVCGFDRRLPAHRYRDLANGRNGDAGVDQQPKAGD
ncbi:MAG: PD-(D/E)XK nuclease family protein [Limnochordaceae bacterium]|nr:PD-(D/E)XK nuclease family protein [Limnochordaceae bacterium]